MDTKHTISISDARKKIFDIARAVQAPSVRYTLTANGQPQVVVISAAEYEALIETQDVMQDVPDAAQLFAQVKRDMVTGAYKKYVKYGTDTKSKHVVRARTKAKRSKRA